MRDATRREFLIFVGGTAGAAAVPGLTLPGRAEAAPPLSLTPVRLPHPLPIYQEQPSFLPTGVGGTGTTLPPAADPKLTEYTVIDDVVVPPEFEVYTILAWGDRVYPNESDYAGFNHDWTGFVSLRGSRYDGWLWVNHEYVSDPFSENFAKVVGFEIGSELEAAGEALYNVGGSLVRIRRGRGNPRYQVDASEPRNSRWHALSGLAINADRVGTPYETVTSWGPRPHQQGNDEWLEGTGPAATDVFAGVDGDGLGNRIIGTNSNCSGGTTPWGTFVTAEENFQFTVQEAVQPNGTQTGYVEGSPGETFGLVGEKYGYVVEFDPRAAGQPDYYPKKHTALGRFRHENIAFRVQAGQPLIAYQGDDRRGGHTWKFVSDGRVSNPRDPANSRLFESGTLYVAKYRPDGTGEWLPLTLATPTNPNVPSVLGSEQLAQQGSIDRGGRVRLPQRAGIAGATESGGSLIVDVDNEAAVLPDYQGKTVADFYTSMGAALVDAFHAANLIGGTPTGRPEDIEVHPRTREVFIAYTDGIVGGDGYVDSRIFTVNKYIDDVDAEQPSGGLYKIVEDSPSGAGTTFTWSKFAKAGEAGAVDGTGYANVDNLAFDARGNIWGVTDMSTSRQNGFRTGSDPGQRTIDHSLRADEADKLVGVFGNNWVFYIPTVGRDAGQIIPFGYGPMRCEMTGPTFVGDTLIISVQHPGEDMPTDENIAADPTGGVLNRDIEILDLEGSVFTQNRTLPLSSEWPREVQGNVRPVPQPATIGIRRKRGRRFV